MSLNITGKVIHCKAVVEWEAGRPLVIEEVEVAPPQTMEVHLNILFTSLCHTDGQTSLFPRIFGHKASGLASMCQFEESNMCDLLRINTDRGVMLNDGKSRFSIKGKPIYHFVGTSIFSEYIVLHVGCVAKINPAALLDKVCVFSYEISIVIFIYEVNLSLLSGLGATLNVAKPTKGSIVAMFGLGAVGFAVTVEGARIAGASRIIGVDLNSNRFHEALKFGVTKFVNPKDHDKPVQECIGNINDMIFAFECVHDGWGVAILVGVPNKDDAFKTHLVNLLNEKTLKGTFFGNYKPRSDLPSIVEMYLNKELEPEKFITHEVPFSEINKAFEYMLKGESIHCVIHMET
ncbi:hypothetical protein UlMin_037851 [Ulmus minor]